VAVIDDNTIAEMLAQAKSASERAYAKYSKFPVGAAILDNRNKIHTGCNVENISVGLTVCAERGAISKMIADGGESIKAVVVYTPTKTPTPCCGMCRQVIWEFGQDVYIESHCKGADIFKTDIKTLLPAQFSSLEG
jgi:cytidine deaminase